MKTLIAVLLCSISLSMLSSQDKSNPIDHLFNSIQESDDIFKFELSGFFLNLSSDDSEKKNGIKSVRIMGAEKAELIPGTAISKFQKGLRANSFETLSEIRSGGDRVQIMMKERKNVVSDFVAVIKGKENFVVIAIEGEFDLDDIDDLNIDVDGFDKVKKAVDEVPRA